MLNITYMENDLDISLPNLGPEDLNLTDQDMKPTTWHMRSTATQDFQFQMLARKLKAAGHPTRLEIMQLLDFNEVSVSGLVDQLELPPAVISHHLMYLRRENLVTSRRVGTAQLYRLSDRRIIGLLDQL